MNKGFFDFRALNAPLFAHPCHSIVAPQTQLAYAVSDLAGAELAESAARVHI
jgi:hypothetical protein